MTDETGDAPIPEPDPDKPRGLPFSAIIGQDLLKRALRLAYIDPKIGGVLLTGDRGTGKTTAARAFTWLAHGKEAVTLPINATEDRVVGWLDVAAALTDNEHKLKEGLLVEARDRGVLYVDEVNLLDDHIVNIILDVAANGRLVLAREGVKKVWDDIVFTLVGTMNPEEGSLRPQLLDRFGLVVNVKTEKENRRAILESILKVSTPRGLDEAWAEDLRDRERIRAAKEACSRAARPPKVIAACIDVATAVDAVGHRGEQVLFRALCAEAAWRDPEAEEPMPLLDDIAELAPLALRHRRRRMADEDLREWDKDEAVAEVVSRHGGSSTT